MAILRNCLHGKADVEELYICGRSQVDDGWKGEMMTALDELLLLLKDERTVSAYELHSSGLVQALFNTLNVSMMQWF